METPNKTIAQIYEEDKKVLKAAKSKEEVIYATWSIKKHGFIDKTEIQEILEEKYHAIELIEGATIVVKAYLNSNDECEREFFNRTNCSIEEFIFALNVLSMHFPQLYQEYFKTRKQKEIEFGKKNNHKDILIREKIDNISIIHEMSTKEKMKMLKSNDKELTGFETNSIYTTYCHMNRLSPSIVRYYSKIATPKELEEFVLAPREEQAEKISRFIRKARIAVKRVACEMNEILKLERSIRVNNLSIKAPMFDLYGFEARSKISFATLKSLSGKINRPNGEKVILTYIRKHKNFFDEFTDGKALATAQSGMITCEGRMIKFNREEGKTVLNEMREKRIPIYRGTMYQAIERKIITSSEDSKPKTYQKTI